MYNNANMLNWTHDIPIGSNIIFKRQLDILKSKNKQLKILEIGTFVGISIINILEYIPNSIGYVIDNWSIDKNECNYDNIDIKQTFYNNIKKSGLYDDERIIIFDGKSTEQLFILHKLKEKFDFIYIDASHKTLDVYSDLILSWKLLDINGILGLDDYLWSISDNPFDNPKKGIDYFLQTYYNEYIILHKNYRVFIQKIKPTNIINNPELSPILIKEGIDIIQRENSFIEQHPQFELKNKQNNFPLFENTKGSKYIYNELIIDDYNQYKNWNNLINICIMVKNAGDGFQYILEQNKPYIDFLTILDTGSTDNTVQIIKETLKDIPGKLYEEKFINFRESRNRLLELAEIHNYVFNIILDDTYILRGNLRNFLELVRKDDIVDSYSLVITDNEKKYNSNRIVRSNRSLRYKYYIHEIIQPENNLNVSVPETISYIEDIHSEYMSNRTKDRKKNDLELLFKQYNEDTNDPRTLYYIADTYLCIKDWKNSYIYYEKRSNDSRGYSAEVQDSLYYLAALSQFYLGKNWDECEEKYLNCYNYDNSRTESLYFIAEHYYNDYFSSGNLQSFDKAYSTILLAYNSGIPIVSMSFRKDIYYYHIPKLLAQLCIFKQNWEVGEECCRKVLNYKEDLIIQNYFNIYTLYTLSLSNDNHDFDFKHNGRKTIVFVSPGGWDKWDGHIYYSRGLGGSETFTVKYGEYLVKYGYNIIVFCDCEKKTECNGVIYIPLHYYISFINSYSLNIDTVIINRFPEYTHITLSKLKYSKIYLVLHDIIVNGMIIPINITGIMCISNWQKEQFIYFFPGLKDKVHTISYGIDLHKYTSFINDNYLITNKEKYSFIFPSFANRGLLPLLKIFPKIREKYPSAFLNIFCDLDNKWLNIHYSDMVIEIRKLLEDEKKYVINHGWVNKDILIEYWIHSHIWFYPCIFRETSCLTAFEAAASKTLVISNNLAALQESIGNRGCIFSHPKENINAQLEYTDDNCNNMLNKIFYLLDNENIQNNLIEKNYDWIQTKMFDIVVKDFENKYINI